MRAPGAEPAGCNQPIYDRVACRRDSAVISPRVAPPNDSLQSCPAPDRSLFWTGRQAAVLRFVTERVVIRILTLEEIPLVTSVREHVRHIRMHVVKVAGIDLLKALLRHEHSYASLDDGVFAALESL